MLKKIALFKSPYGFITPILFEVDMDNYVRITEYVDIEFPELPKEEVIVNSITAIDGLIKQEKDRDQTRLFQTVACKAVVRCVGTLGQCNTALHFPTIHLPTFHFTVIIIGYASTPNC